MFEWLDAFFYMMDKKVKIMLLVFLILPILAYVYFFGIKGDNREVRNEGVTIEENLEDKPILTPPTVKDDREPQDSVLKRYKMRVIRSIDRGNKIDYIVELGVEDTKIETQVEVNQNTVFYDAIRKLTGGPNIVLDDMEVVFIGTGSPQIKDLKASLIIVGATPNIKYSEVKSVNIDGDNGGYIYELDSNNEYLAVPDGISVLNGISGAVLSDIREIKEGVGIIYTVKPEFTQESFGLLYEAEEIIYIKGVVN